MNDDIKKALKTKNMYLWELADLLRVSEQTIVRKMRHELSEGEKTKILRLIQDCNPRLHRNRRCEPSNDRKRLYVRISKDMFHKLDLMALEKAETLNDLVNKLLEDAISR